MYIEIYSYNFIVVLFLPSSCRKQLPNLIVICSSWQFSLVAWRRAVINGNFEGYILSLNNIILHLGAILKQCMLHFYMIDTCRKDN